MGTNYYVDVDPCGHCQRPAASLHFGKSGYMLHGYRGDHMPEGTLPADVFPLDSLAAWGRLFDRYPASVARDEYGDRIPLAEMVATFSTPEDETLREQRITAVRRQHAYDQGAWLDPDQTLLVIPGWWS